MLRARWIWIAVTAAVALAVTLVVVLRPAQPAGPSAPTALAFGASTTVNVGGRVTGLELTPDGRLFAATSDGVAVLDARTNAVLGRIGIRPYGSLQSGLLTSPDGQRVYSRSTSGMEFVDLKTNLVGDPVLGRDVGMWNELIGFSGDGKRVFGISNNDLVAADIPSGATRRIAAVGSIPRSVAIVPDGSKIYLPAELTGGGGIDQPLRVVDIATGATSAVPGSEGANEVALAPDGRTLHTIGFHGVIVLDIATGEVLREVDTGLLQGDIGVVPGGRNLVILKYDGSVELFDIEAGRVVASLPVPKFPRDLAITADARRLFVASEGGVVAIDLTPVL